MQKTYTRSTQIKSHRGEGELNTAPPTAKSSLLLIASGKGAMLSSVALSLSATLWDRAHPQVLLAETNQTPCFLCLLFLVCFGFDRKNMKLGEQERGIEEELEQGKNMIKTYCMKILIIKIAFYVTYFIDMEFICNIK